MSYEFLEEEWILNVGPGEVTQRKKGPVKRGVLSRRDELEILEGREDVGCPEGTRRTESKRC